MGCHQTKFFDDVLMTFLMTIIFYISISYTLIIKIIKIIELKDLRLTHSIKPAFGVEFMGGSISTEFVL